MSKKKKRRKNKLLKLLKLPKLRKPIAPPTKVFISKNAYNRKKSKLFTQKELFKCTMS